jgi:hypothetical protein
LKSAGGSLANLAGRTGIFYSEPLDLDLTARAKGALGAAAWSPKSGLRGGASPALANLGAQEIKTTRAWVLEVQRDMGKPLRAKAGLGKDSCDTHDDGAGLRGGASPACGVPV